jgi:hypothetical protein
VELPSYININDKTYHFQECNTYQQTLYAEIVRLNGMMQKEINETLKIKHLGVIEYLAAKLSYFGGLTKIKNIYDSGELTGDTQSNLRMY